VSVDLSLYLSPAAETVDTYSRWDAGGPVNVNEVRTFTDK